MRSYDTAAEPRQAPPTMAGRAHGRSRCHEPTAPARTPCRCPTPLNSARSGGPPGNSATGCCSTAPATAAPTGAARPTRTGTSAGPAATTPSAAAGPPARVTSRPGSDPKAAGRGHAPPQETRRKYVTERQRPQRGSDVEAWIKRYRETYRDSIGQTTGAWWAIDGLLDDYQDHADSSTPLDQIGRRQRIWDCKIGEVP